MVMGMEVVSEQELDIVPANKEHRRIKCGVQIEQWYCGSQVSGEQ